MYRDNMNRLSQGLGYGLLGPRASRWTLPTNQICLKKSKISRISQTITKYHYKNKHIVDEIPVKELNWFLKIFTIGDKFSLQDFFDRAKKMVVEFFAIFFGVFLSLAVDQKRENSNHRSDNINNMKKLKVELQDILVYTDEYIEGVTWFNDLFQRQYDRWGENSDSVFFGYYG